MVKKKKKKKRNPRCNTTLGLYKCESLYCVLRFSWRELNLPLCPVWPPGNCNLVYAIIRKRNVFHQLANLPSDAASIQKALQRKRKSPDVISRTSSQETVSMEGSHPAVPAEPGTLKASLVAIPGTGSVICRVDANECLSAAISGVPISSLWFLK